MKTIQFITIFIILMFCSCETDPAKRNVKKFVEDAIQESIMLDKKKVKSIEITETDSLLSPIIATIGTSGALNAKYEYMEGKITRDSLMSWVAHNYGYYLGLFQAWYEDPKPLRKNPKFQSFWRKAYQVNVTFEDGTTRNPRVIMNEDGITPNELEGKVEIAIDQFRREMENLTYI